MPLTYISVCFHCVLALVYMVNLRVATVTRQETIIKWAWQRKPYQINVIQYSLMLSSESGTESEFFNALRTLMMIKLTEL